MRTLFVLVMMACAAGCATAKKNDSEARPAREIVSGGAELRGGHMRMTVTVGGPVGPRGTATAPGAPMTVRSAGVVTP